MHDRVHEFRNDDIPELRIGKHFTLFCRMATRHCFLFLVMAGLVPAIHDLNPCFISPSPASFARFLPTLYSGHFGRFAPYFERRCLRFLTPWVSSTPRRMWYRTPGRSLTRPPRIMTTECSCRLWPSPGIYPITSKPLVSLTLATLRNAEFGFLGVVV